MKVKKIFVITFILIIFFIAFLLLKSFITRKNNEILKNENIQIELLKKIYTNFIESNNKNNDNIILDNTALRNLLTKETFSEEHQYLLKQIGAKENPDFTYILSLTYNIDSKILKLTLMEENGLETIIQKYKLNIKNNNLVFEPTGIVFSYSY